MNDEDEFGMRELLADAQAVCAARHLRELLREHWPDLCPDVPSGAGGGAPLSMRIHRDDQMLLHSLRHHRDPSAAVSQYFNVALQQYRAARQILDATFPAATSGRVEVLDFACGFGRLLRFLTVCDRDLAIRASEIQADALDFVGSEFGVPTLASHLQPEVFEPGRRFDFIWVASLFSHLPEHLFHRWISRLHALLTPRGVLCFSVHDEALLPAGETLPASGLLFRPHSENANLDAQAYGTTYVSEAFVRRAIERSLGAGHAIHRLRKALAHEQDVYVVAADRARNLGALAAFRRGPWGWVDERRVEGDTLVLRGWAASLDDGPLGSVHIEVDGRAHRCPTGSPRPDVGAFFGDPRLTASGWVFRLDLGSGSPRPWVSVTAHSERGECALLYAGWPGGVPHADSVGEHVYHREIDASQRSSLSVLAALVAPGSRVLDIGTGSGALGRHLSTERSCRVDGVTRSSAERVLAQPWYERIELLDIEQPGWAERFIGERYDFVVCADVLEHLREPEPVLAACRELLRPDGWLLASVPNVAYAGMVVELIHGEWRYGAEGLLDRTHLRFFTRRSFRRLLESQGWRVERVEPIELTWYYTEFWTPFDRLPPAVARYLLAQPDASAYQLVYAASRREDAPARLNAPVPPPDTAVQVAVYASTLAVADGRGGTRGVPALGRVGAHRQTLRFAIPADTAPAAGLHWHPADRPGYLHLHAVTLRDADGRTRWEWRADQGDDTPWREVARRQVEIGSGGAHLALRLAGNDPHIALPVPPAAFVPDRGPWTVEIECGWPLSADYLAFASADCSVHTAADPTVEIVVPAYGNLGLLRRCLSSVVDARCQRPWHLTVIDDASPQPEIGRWLHEFAHVHPEVTVLANARNLGFVATANLGMRLAGRRDVVLLNSDTEVAGDWLDRLARAAASAPRAGTVTPFSNNATICSYPRFCEENELPAGHTAASLDALFARTHPGRTVDIPTAVGFCMYIRRDCLDDTGEFDAATFGAGYGEENDFCMRASERGWRHLHALDVFVYHAGGESFGERRQALQANALAAIRRRHPRYEEIVREFVALDPARPAREAIGRLCAAATVTARAHGR